MTDVLNDRVFDNGLTVLDTEANELWITTSAADGSLVYATVEAAKLGSKSSPTVSAPADRSGGGREVTVSAITDGTVTANGTAARWALVDTGNSRVLANGALSATQTVTSGNTFTLASFKVGIPDPA
jgi:hypothetical protein